MNKEHILKNEFHPIGGPIKDIAWSPDSQRMIVVGEGRERQVHVLLDIIIFSFLYYHLYP